MIFHHHTLSTGKRFFSSRIQKNASWASHFHKNLELQYVIKGELECTVNGKTEILREGDFALCLSNEIHSGRTLSDSLLFICIFSEDYVRSFTSYVEGKYGDTFKFNCNEHLKNYLDQVFLCEGEQELLVQKACLYAILNEYLGAVTLREKSKSAPDATSRILDFIEERYKTNVTLADLATHLNYDYHYTSRLFNSLFRMSFCDFVSLYRMKKAAELLSDKNKKILNVAFESGFQSVRSFNNRFKSYSGLSPKEYRKTLF